MQGDGLGCSHPMPTLQALAPAPDLCPLAGGRYGCPFTEEPAAPREGCVLPGSPWGRCLGRGARVVVSGPRSFENQSRVW